MIRSPGPEDGKRVTEALLRFADLCDEWWTLDEMAEDIARGRRALWVVADGRAVAMTRVLRGVLHVDAIEGEGLEEWGDAFDAAMRAEAKRLGCRQVACRARRGWAAFGRRHGWRETHREYRVEV